MDSKKISRAFQTEYSIVLVSVKYCCASIAVLLAESKSEKWMEITQYNVKYFAS